MQQLLIYFFLAIGLSMDAFSLALAYGTNNLPIKKKIILSILVGIFHFLMPYLGSIIGGVFLEKLLPKADIIVSLIFFLLALEMFISRNEEKKGVITNIASMSLFSLTVSIDSFSVGIAIGITKATIIEAAIIFSIISCFFTFLGLILGQKLSEKFGKKATYIGIAILIALSINYLI